MPAHTRILPGLMTLLLLAGGGGDASAQESRPYTVDSAILGEARTFTVHLPASYQERTDVVYPVVYLLDGEANAAFAVAVSDFLSDSGAAPEVITVALHAGLTRARDYQPPTDASAPEEGGADRYLRHVADEVIPFVEAELRAAPLRVLSGHSLGGLFVMHAMMSRPELFRAYLAQSPYLVPGMAAPLLRRLAEFEPAHAEVFFFANLGEEPDLAPQFARLHEVLGTTRASGFSWDVAREEGMGHMETRLVGHYDGLEGLFAHRWRFSAQDVSADGVEGLDRYLEGLEDWFGYPVLPGEAAFQQAVQILFSRQDVPGALQASDRYVAHHPRSLAAHFLRANALAAGGSRDEAVGSLDRGIELYEAEPAPGSRAVYEQMKQLRSRLTGSDR